MPAAAATIETMRHITLDLIRKRSEHNQGLVSNLEEIALHQEEIETIGPVLSRASGKTLKILLLQNNIIGRLVPADLRQFKSLEYLNLALNNIEVVEGIEHLEFLKKLDFTLNFIHLDKLKESVECMSKLRSLKELFMLGNPCMNTDIGSNGDGDGSAGESSKQNEGWKHTRAYIIHKIPQLEYLDGTEITRSERIKARQIMRKVEGELEDLAAKCRKQKLSKKLEIQGETSLDHPIEDEEVTRHCPEDRLRLGKELAQQKAEKEANENANKPKFKNEKNHEQEQHDTIQRARTKEETGNFKQCNEGRWHFEFDEEKRPGYLTLDITIQKHLSSSLIDVDIHPTYVSVVIKSKVLRLRLPAEVRSEASTAQRSATTGHLLLIMPKCNPEYNGLMSNVTKLSSNHITKNTPVIIKPREQKAQDETSAPLKGPVILKGLVKECDGGIKQESNTHQLDMVERSTLRTSTSDDGSDDNYDSDDEESPPPLI